MVKKIAIVDDNYKYRYALKYLLQTISDIEVVGEASNGFDFLKSLNEIIPDVVFMDAEMAVLNGLQTSKVLMQNYPHIRIIILTISGEEKYYQQIFDLGIKNFISKDSEIEKFELAIHNAMEENNNSAFQKYLNGGNKDLGNNLTKKELEVLNLIAKGFTNKKISKELEVSTSTIERRRAKILKKTNTRNPVNLIVFAVKNKLIDINQID